MQLWQVRAQSSGRGLVCDCRQAHQRPGHAGPAIRTVPNLCVPGRRLC